MSYSNTSCSFADGISKYEFYRIVKKAIKKNDRILEIKVFDAAVYGLVRSHSGLKTWRFKLDFNDQGHLTGFYQCETLNEESTLPTHIGDSIKTLIVQRKVGIGVD